MPNLSLFLQNGWSLSGAGCVLVDGGGVGGGESDCRNISDKNLGEAATAAKPLQSCLTLCDPIDGSPGSLIPGIPRQEHWSGLPFPSPMHESEK